MLLRLLLLSLLQLLLSRWLLWQQPGSSGSRPSPLRRGCCCQGGLLPGMDSLACSAGAL